MRKQSNMKNWNIKIHIHKTLANNSHLPYQNALVIRLGPHLAARPNREVHICNIILQ